MAHVLGTKSWLAASAGLCVLGWLLASWWSRRPPEPIPRARLSASAYSRVLAQPQAPTTVATPHELQPAPPDPHFAVPAASLVPRDPSEWQGMLVDRAVAPPCSQSSDCGMARACIDHQCVNCKRDEDCARSETCVLDHCLQSSMVSCRSWSDCQPAQKCVLSGYSYDLRGNSTMTARCVGPGTPMPPRTRPPPAPSTDPQPNELDDLMDRAGRGPS